MKLRAAAACFAGLLALAVCLATDRPAAQSTDASPLGDVFETSREHRAIQYTARDTTDPVSRLNRRIANRQVTLSFDAGSGYLRSLLDALGVPIESQMAVFSKTSLQAPIISPRNPRVIFFNDSVAVAWPRGGFIELASVDPEQGTIFYRLPQTPASSPALVRSDAICLTCHATSATLGVPGFATASVVADADGLPSDLPTRIIDQRSPVGERWGGWYVTATHLPMPHMGNLVATDPAHPTLVPTPQSIERPSLSATFDTTSYPAASSDVVALLVMNHQTRMINLMTRLGWETRVALTGDRTGASNNSAPPTSAGAGVPSRVTEWARELVDYMLFVDEAPLTGPIVGSSGFAEQFAAAGPRDRQGRTLRALDLTHRLFKYPCSYLIYSEQFDHLPSSARDAVYARLRQILSGAETAPRYARLTAADRQAITEILRETKPEAAAYLG